MHPAYGHEMQSENQNSHSLGAQNDDDIRVISRIQEALHIAHDSSSTKEARNEAYAFLDQIKCHNQAPGHGFMLASDATQQPTVRHYALSLLEYAVKYKWREYSEVQETTLRGWVIHLARSILPSDPVYLRNKVAQLWVEVAKRSWCSSWKDMNEQLILFWNMPVTEQKEFVLYIIENLSEDVFGKEDIATIMRGDTLQKACTEIFAPSIANSEAFSNQENNCPISSGDEGWLIRIGKFFDYLLDNRLYEASENMKCIVRILSVYKSVSTWIFPAAISNSSCVNKMIKALTVSKIDIQMASVEAFHSLYSRLHMTNEEFTSLVCPILTENVVDLLRRLFDWSCVDPHNIDEEKYQFSKKFSEMISSLGILIEKKILVIPKDCDLPNLFNLFFTITRSESFLVSIPTLPLWTKLLQSDKILELSAINLLIAPLLELVSTRLIRYDVLKDDSEDPSMIFLFEDIDTVPERHTFLGNYRLYIVQIIEIIVYKKHSEAIHHILSQAELSLRYLFDTRTEISVENYSKYSLPALKVDAQFTMIEAALRGYIKWRSVTEPKTQEDEQNRVNVENYMEAWCERILSLKFEDPIIRKRLLQASVIFSTSALDQNNSFMLKVLEQILTNRVLESPEHLKYTEAVKEMQLDCLIELQRLALKMPDQLLDVYDQLESIVNEIIASGTTDIRSQVAFQAFLFTIIHRNSRLKPEVCCEKLHNFIKPVQAVWQDTSLDQTLSSFDQFSQVLGMDKVKKYLIARKAHQIEDWSLHQLDEEGHVIKQEIEDRSKILPLRTTKNFLQCSTDRLDLSSPKLQIARSLWKSSIPIILPKLLSFLRYAHAFHNPENWTGLPPEMATVVNRILSDRFWQAGISEGSKEDFYASVSGTRSTMEGLASTIRGCVRSIRENTYGIFQYLSRFDSDFYGYNELPGPLAHSLFVDAHFLSSHQIINLLQVVRLLIDDCPVELRAHFIPPLLATCYRQIDLKCTTQWEKLTVRQNAATIGQNLTDEMKQESLLRQVTHAAVMMIGTFLDPSRANFPNPKDCSTLGLSTNTSFPSMRMFCLSSPGVVEPILTFLSHAIEMRDTRSCGVALRIFRSIIPEFSQKKDKLNEKENTEILASIREFICHNVLMACISSLNEPYFVDLQRDIVNCIVSILVYYCEESTTPRQVLLKIPKVGEEAVNKCLQNIINPTIQARHQRALVLDLLNDIKGVSISEQGRLSKPPASSCRRERSKMHQAFMSSTTATVKSNGSPILESIANLFNNE
ncbi:putative arm repeat-containing protein [Erysiphe necator]|uniref:Putative arm repeat-containing protein n=1 Tax=Uncinula necator TaxID=52586 RepID=A0A0B1P1Q3_UNCNE|nr:putative arm repeat-containing protein [Erysiphe necator]